MGISSRWVIRQIAYCLVLFLAARFAEAAAAPRQEASSGEQPQSVALVQGQPQSSASQAKISDAHSSESGVIHPDNPEPVRPQPAGQSGQSDTSQSGLGQSLQGRALKPVGTAAAPYEKTTGVAASRPAGAVIAPAKQRRARSILIRVGIVVGAAVAVGTVMALSHGSPSRPQ